MLIGFTGKAGTGKDTAADFMVRRFAFEKYSFALPIKQALNAMFGWSMSQWDDRAWKETPQPGLATSPRILAQTLGTEWGREVIHPDLWVKIARRRYVESPYSLVIPDVRFPNEAEWITREGGLVIELTRKGVRSVAAHKSEDGLPADLIDLTIPNNGSPNDLFNELIDTLNL